MKWIRCCVAFLGFLLLSGCGNGPKVSVFDLMPLQTAVMIESSNPQELMEALHPYLQTAGTSQLFEDEFTAMDSILMSNEKTKAALNDAQIVFSLVNYQGEYKSLVVCMLDKTLTNKDLMHALNCDASAYHKLGNTEYFQYDSLMVVAQNGFLAFSRDENVILDLVSQYGNPQKISDDADFQRVYSTMGNSVNSHVYLNYSQLNDFVLNSLSEKCEDVSAQLTSRIKGLASLDLLMKDDGIVMNGYSKATDTVSCLKPLKYQLPVRNSIIDVLPFNTKMMLHYGMSDFVSYWEEFADKQTVDGLNKRLGVDVESQFVKCMSEISYSVFGSASQPVFVARLNDPAAMIQFSTRLIAKVGASETVTEQGYTMLNLNLSNFIPDVFGEYFKSIKRCCYSIVDQYLVVTNDFNTLQEVISCYRSGRTLDLNENFKDFQNNMLDEANISYFVLCAENQKFINSFLGGQMTEFLKKNPEFLSHYQAVSVQFASSKDLVYTCAAIRNQSEVKEERNIHWKANLDAPLRGKPFFVSNPANNSNDVVVFDTENTMYLIDPEGNVLWKNELEEPLMSDVFSVDALKNGQRQLLFNTKNYIYLIDRNGANMEGFPLKLLAEASNGLSLVDYAGTTDSRIIICGTDRFVYNYNLNGMETEGWNRHRTDDLVTKPIQHVVADNKDFIIVTDSKGCIRILDRQGSVRIPLVEDLRKSQFADFYENRTNRKGVLLTSDDKGDLLYIAMNGNLARTDFGDFSNSHFFMYEDFNANQDPDFIYLDGKDLWVFDRFKNILFEHSFDSAIDSKPMFFNVSRNKRLLGIVSSSSREIYLIDSKGNMVVGSGMVGETPFAVGSLHNNNEVNLVTGVGNAVYNYIIR